MLHVSMATGCSPLAKTSNTGLDIVKPSQLLLTAYQ